MLFYLMYKVLGAQMSRLLPEDGDRIQSLKRYVLNKKQDDGLFPKNQQLY
jgi:hypothetical protein